MKSKRKYKLDVSCFDNLNNKTAYWIGFIYGDGNCTNENKIRIALQWKDKGHLIKFRSFVGSIDRPIKEVITDRCHNASFEFRNWNIHNRLAKYQMNQRKENRGRIHFSLLQPDIRRHFFRGLFDADGSLYYNKKSKHLYSEITGNMPILKDVKNILVEDKIINETKNIVKNGSVFRLRFAKDDTIKLINYLYQGENIVYLDRKYAIAKEYRERLNVQNINHDISDSPQKYHRPVESFNIGKKGEHQERAFFVEK